MARKSMKKKGGCYAGGCTGGKRRSRSRRMRGGMYGFEGGTIGSAGLVASPAYSGAADPKTGAAIPDPALGGSPQAGSYTGLGGRRRTRKTRKSGRKSRKTRKMKGGATQMSAQNAGYGYTGTGAGGLADATPTSSNPGNAF